MRKEERAYLYRMEAIIDERLDAGDSSSLTCMEDFYKEFGEPHDIIYFYLSEMDLKSFYSFISIRYFLKRTAFFLCTLMFVAAIFGGYLFWQEHQLFLQSRPANIYVTSIQK
ncbi:MAG: hypothetical protein K6F51_12195 [Acetatifactor sp.]|nr:hypothetical protein [Acetatifactor sp.]